MDSKKATARTKLSYIVEEDHSGRDHLGGRSRGERRVAFVESPRRRRVSPGASFPGT